LYKEAGKATKSHNFLEDSSEGNWRHEQEKQGKTTAHQKPEGFPVRPGPESSDTPENKLGAVKNAVFRESHLFLKKSQFWGWGESEKAASKKNAYSASSSGTQKGKKVGGDQPKPTTTSQGLKTL